MTRITLFVLIVAGSALLAGFVIGRAQPDVTIRTGAAYAAEGAISIQSDDWTYGVPDDVAWIGADNAWRESGRPECLAPSTAIIEDVRFASVDATIEGVAWRPVIWVDCR